VEICLRIARDCSRGGGQRLSAHTLSPLGAALVKSIERFILIMRSFVSFRMTLPASLAVQGGGWRMTLKKADLSRVA
jgi:hypothetical protein